jgi:hypothetical protein
VHTALRASVAVLVAAPPPGAEISSPQASTASSSARPANLITNRCQDNRI